MKKYRFYSQWRIPATLDEVWNLTEDICQWPNWWYGVQKIETLNKEHGLYQSHIKSRLPYTLVCQVKLARNISQQEKYYELFGGDLKGWALWKYSSDQGQTVIDYWQEVEPQRLWMRLLAPFARPFFHWNHRSLMRQVTSGIESQLQVSLTENHATPNQIPDTVDPLPT